MWEPQGFAKHRTPTQPARILTVGMLTVPQQTGHKVVHQLRATGQVMTHLVNAQHTKKKGGGGGNADWTIS